MRDTKENRVLAQIKINQIQLDILMAQFDPTLKKYKPQSVTKPVHVLSVQELWEEYCEARRDEVAIRTYQDKWRSLSTRLKQFGQNIMTHEDAEGFKQHLAKFSQPRQVKQKLTDLSACFDWAISRGMTPANPIKPLLGEIKVKSKRKRKPFTKSEVKAICNYFARKYPFYANYVQFLLLTGTRTSEAIGLTWDKIDWQNSEIIINSSLTRGIRKGTKTDKDRIIPMNEELRNLLLCQRDQYPDGLVFRSSEGHAIRDGLFRKRYWKPCLEALEIPYRPPYTTRHTFTSHCIALGMNPVKVSKVTGNSVRVLLDEYADVIDRVEIPYFLQ
jgi:integrase